MNDIVGVYVFVSECINDVLLGWANWPASCGVAATTLDSDNRNIDWMR